MSPAQRSRRPSGGGCGCSTPRSLWAGHSERLLGRGAGRPPEARIVTKVGLGIDPQSGRSRGSKRSPRHSPEASRGRAGGSGATGSTSSSSTPTSSRRRQPPPCVRPGLETERARGRIGAFAGARTFPTRRRLFCGADGALPRGISPPNLFIPAPTGIGRRLARKSSPLSSRPRMGLLAGRSGANAVRPNRTSPRDPTSLQFETAGPTPGISTDLGVRDLLTAERRSLAQGHSRALHSTRARSRAGCSRRQSPTSPAHSIRPHATPSGDRENTHGATDPPDALGVDKRCPRARASDTCACLSLASPFPFRINPRRYLTRAHGHSRASMICRANSTSNGGAMRGADGPKMT